MVKVDFGLGVMYGLSYIVGFVHAYYFAEAIWELALVFFLMIIILYTVMKYEQYKKHKEDGNYES